jgi:hypothetical protein
MNMQRLVGDRTAEEGVKGSFRGESNTDRMGKSWEDPPVESPDLRGNSGRVGVKVPWESARPGTLIPRLLHLQKRAWQTSSAPAAIWACPSIVAESPDAPDGQIENPDCRSARPECQDL